MNEFWPEVKDHVDIWVHMFGKKCTPAQVRVLKDFANWVDGGSPSLYEKRIKAAQLGAFSAGVFIGGIASLFYIMY